MKVKLAYASMPDDEEIEVAHLGVFKNNETHDLTEEQVEHWEHETGREWPGTLELPPTEVQTIAAVGTDEEFPVHRGGGTYVLSDGSTVKGKEEAEAAEAELAKQALTPEENGGE